MIAPTVTLADIPLDTARIIRLCVAHQALSAGYWAGGEGEDRARDTLARLQQAQIAVETGIRASGHTVQPEGEG